MKTSKDVIRPSSAQWRALDLKAKTSTSTRCNLKDFYACFHKNTPRKASFYFFFHRKVSTAIYTEVG